MIATCLLCNRKLRPHNTRRQIHPRVDDCLVRFTDEFGISVDELEEQIPEVRPLNAFVEIAQVFPTVDDVLRECFHAYGLERLGGESIGRGWSSISLFQRCRFAWKTRYLDRVAHPIQGVESAALAIGSLIHTYLAVFYQRMIVPDYPLTPDLVKTFCETRANPAFVKEAWRVFYQYAILYHEENIQPLAVEYGIKDPRTGESCRYDMIAFFPMMVSGRMPGTYAFEHKSAGRFDLASLSWANDGEILGQIMLWKRLGLDKRFGELQGVIVNILGKQPKEPQFHRTIVAPTAFQLAQHQQDLRVWGAEMNAARATGIFPRSRAGCINRYGLCEHYETCATVEPAT